MSDTKTKGSFGTLVVIGLLIGGALYLTQGGSQEEPHPEVVKNQPQNCVTTDVQQCMFFEVDFTPPNRTYVDVHVELYVDAVLVHDDYPTRAAWSKYISVPKGAKLLLKAWERKGEYLGCIIFDAKGYPKVRDSIDRPNESGVNCATVA